MLTYLVAFGENQRSLAEGKSKSHKYIKISSSIINKKILILFVRFLPEGH